MGVMGDRVAELEARVAKLEKALAEQRKPPAKAAGGGRRQEVTRGRRRS